MLDLFSFISLLKNVKWNEGEGAEGRGVRGGEWGKKVSQ